MNVQTWLDTQSRTDSPWCNVVPSLRRRRFIWGYRFPAGLQTRFAAEYSGLSVGQREKVWEALRHYFLVCAMAGKNMCAMPSFMVDEAWHHFILFTRDYEHFCRNAFGNYLHHTPAEAMPQNARWTARDPLLMGMKRTWNLACRLEGINAQAPHRLPLLFGIDEMLGLPDTPRYEAQEMARRCGMVASSSGCGGSCGGDSGSDCSDSGSSNGCGDGGSSCGGSSCGGGCGGGD